MRTSKLLALVGICAGCGGSVSVGGPAKEPDERGTTKTAGGTTVDKAAEASFQTALDSFAAHEKASDWSESTCTSVADQFRAAAKSQESATNKGFPEALYNAGLAYQRCGKDADAKAQFESALKAQGGFHRAKAQLALYEYTRTGNVDAAIGMLDSAIREAKFQNVEALVSLAALQMVRGSDQPDGDGKDDLERAKKNIQRALAIDDGFMPAFNQLSLLYFEQARAKARGKEEKGRRRRRAMVVASSKKADLDEAMLELAALVASQAVQKNPKYAPIHNTAGLIQVELKNFNGAVKSFKQARDLDPKFFEAHMNYAAVNLSFRGFAEAEKAYRDALRLQPKDFEANLGLALAMRGQIDDSNYDKYVAETQKYLDEARKIDSARAETYYNEAILTQEYKAKGEQKAAIPMLEKAKDMYKQFVAKAGSDPAFADAVKRSNERIQDITDTVKFLVEGEKAREEAEAAAAAAAAAQPPPAAPTDAPPAAGAAPPGGAPPAAGATPAEKK
jgi:tetratricopeptide (TPR) repeat protein